MPDYLIVAADLVVTALTDLSSTIWNCAQYIVFILGFGAFVAWNGGVVLGNTFVIMRRACLLTIIGDKSNHVATMHFPQMLYIWAYMMFFSFPVILGNLFEPTTSASADWIGFMATRRPRVWFLAAFTAIFLAIIYFNTIIHPFTLADNRHYVFYVFRILRRHWAIKYLLAPVYVVSGWLAMRTMTSNRHGNEFDRRWKIGYGLVWLAATSLSLITAPLVEPRYFIVPWVLWRLQVQPTSSVVLSLETAWYGLINAITGFMFLYRSFGWEQEPGARQRFMW